MLPTSKQNTEDSPKEGILGTGQQVQGKRGIQKRPGQNGMRSVWQRAPDSGRRRSREGRQRIWAAWGRGERVPLLILSFRGFFPFALPGT